MAQEQIRISSEWGEVTATLADNTAADALLEMSSRDRNAAFMELEQALEVTAPMQPTSDYEPLTWDQVRDAAQRGVIIGAHSTAHVPMARESHERQLEMAAHSKKRIEAELGIVVRHFCYPHGRARDFDQHGIYAARAAGFDSSVAANPQGVRGPELLFAMPRLSPPQQTADLRAKLSGLEYLRDWVGT